MSLNYQFRTPIADELFSKTGAGEGHMTETIILSTMIVGVPALLTDADVDRYAVRIAAYESCFGTFCKILNDKNELDDLPITRAALELRKRLTTNASKLTDAQFIKRIGERALQDAQREFSYQLRRDAEAKAGGQ